MLCALLASTALYAEFNAGYYSQNEPGTIRQTLPFAASTSTSYEVGAYPLFPFTLAPGDGRQEVTSYCNTCHTPRFIITQPPLPGDVWAAEVNKMVKTYGASIPDDATQKIIQYLQSHYTPETRKK
ncbi:MAG: hypothetical protein WAK91_14805 [Candidatus Acidiferrales bacterium]